MPCVHEEQSDIEQEENAEVKRARRLFRLSTIALPGGFGCGNASVLGSDPDVPVSELLFELPIQEMLYELSRS